MDFLLLAHWDWLVILLAIKTSKEAFENYVMPASHCRVSVISHSTEKCTISLFHLKTMKLVSHVVSRSHSFPFTYWVAWFCILITKMNLVERKVLLPRSFESNKPVVCVSSTRFVIFIRECFSEQNGALRFYHPHTGSNRSSNISVHTKQEFRILVLMFLAYKKEFNEFLQICPWSELRLIFFLYFHIFYFVLDVERTWTCQETEFWMFCDAKELRRINIYSSLDF